MLYIHPLYIDHNSLQLTSRSRKIISNLCPTLSNIYETSSCPLKRRAHHDRRFDPTETNPRSVQGYRNSRTGFRDEPQGRGQNRFPSVSSLPNEQSGRVARGLNFARVSIRLCNKFSSIEGGGRRIDRPPSPHSYRWEKAPDLQGGEGGGINPSLNDALSPPFIKRSFRRLQVAARRLMEFLGDGGGRSCE